MVVVEVEVEAEPEVFLLGKVDTEDIVLEVRVMVTGKAEELSTIPKVGWFLFEHYSLLSFSQSLLASIISNNLYYSMQQIITIVSHLYILC